MQDEWEDKTLVGAGVSLAPPGIKAPRLVVLAGGNVGEIHEVALELTVGRGPEAKLRVEGDGISRKHARVQVLDERVTLEDLGSTNGSFVNGVRVRVNEPQPLCEGDQIQIGSGLVLKFTYRDQFDVDCQRRLLESSGRDPLTEIYNRRFFLEQLGSEVAFALRHRSELSLLLLEIDAFEELRALYGQAACDAVLRELPRAVVPAIRVEDLFARFGVARFALVSRAGARAAGVVAERLRVCIAQHDFIHEASRPDVTVSVGVESMPNLVVGSAMEFVAAVERTLSEALLVGRDRVLSSASRP